MPPCDGIPALLAQWTFKLNSDRHEADVDSALSGVGVSGVVLAAVILALATE